MSDSDRFIVMWPARNLIIVQKVKRGASSAVVSQRARSKEDEDRWAKNEALQNEEEAKLQRMRDNPSIMGYRSSKKNQSNVAYDITNLQYKQDTTGEAQQYYDNMVRYRAQARTRALVVLGDSRVPYNILNGDQRELPPRPSEVARPVHR